MFPLLQIADVGAAEPQP